MVGFRGKRHGRAVSLLALTMVIMPVAEGQAGPVCASAADMTALNTRVLQTELMVAALSCSQQGEYNDFIRQFQPQLSGQANALRALFRRQHGKGSENRLNVFITQLANESSHRSLAVWDTYCTTTGELFHRALNTSPARFTSLTQEDWIGSRHDYRACTTTVASAPAAKPRASTAATPLAKAPEKRAVTAATPAKQPAASAKRPATQQAATAKP